MRKIFLIKEHTSRFKNRNNIENAVNPCVSRVLILPTFTK